jgi:peptidoglycan-associated lipoprotein
MLRKMKNAKLIGMFLVGAALTAGMTGCKHTSMVTPIPELAQPQPKPGSSDNNAGGTGVGVPVAPPVTEGPIAMTDSKWTGLITGPHDENRELFKADTVYFDLDSSTIKPSEESKLQHVADYFKGNQKLEALTIEGNCDERGTEKYNLSLGERRALAAREYLANLGVDPQRINTVTYGKSRPAESGHNEAAWKKNRRDEFILLTPKQ